MANFTVNTEVIKFPARKPDDPNRAAHGPEGGRHGTRWRKLAKKIWHWIIRLVLMPVPDWPPRRKEERPAESERQFAGSSFYDALSEDGPFRRMSAEEAHRHVICACAYYVLLAAGILAMIIWH